MITKEQLQAMSDDQVFDQLGNITGAYISRNEPHESIMPLAFEHGISLIKMLDGWRAILNRLIGRDLYVDCANPLRAIACCLILVLQEKQK